MTSKNPQMLYRLSLLLAPLSGDAWQRACDVIETLEEIGLEGELLYSTVEAYIQTQGELSCLS
jgi:hypothetical protein